jgi:hypothetical protein
VVNGLLKYAKKPEGPLQILQGELEMGIQLVTHTLHAYKGHYLQLPQGQIVPMTDLGYEPRLCNMALVNAAASWDGFEGNIVHIVREGSHLFSKQLLSKHLKQIGSYQHIIEPLARRHCIVHNLAKVDRDYKKAVPSSSLVIDDSLDTNLSYLENASVSFFKTARELVGLLVRDGLLKEECQKTIGEFQHNAALEEPRAMKVLKFKKA